MKRYSEQFTVLHVNTLKTIDTLQNQSCLQQFNQYSRFFKILEKKIATIYANHIRHLKISQTNRHEISE